MPAVSGFAITQLSGLEADVWTPIIPPRQWMGVTVVNDTNHAVLISTDPDDETASFPIEKNGGQFTVQAPYGSPGLGTANGAPRFPSGAIAFYLQPDGGTVDDGITLIWA